MTRTYVLTNNKGGVGKSTSATNISLGIVAMLQQTGAARSRVLLVDTDSQAHATLVTTGHKDYGQDDSLYRVLMADPQEAVQALSQTIIPSTWHEQLHILPASALLEQAERELMSVAGAPYRLSDPLSKIVPYYGAIVIDTRPTFSLLTEMALVAATDALIPVEPRYLETVGLLNVLYKVHAIRDGWRATNLRVSGIVVTKHDKRIKGHRHLLDEIKHHPTLGRLLSGVIPMNEAVSYAHRAHQSIYAYNPKGTASEAYARLVTRLVRRSEAQPGGAA